MSRKEFIERCLEDKTAGPRPITIEEYRKRQHKPSVEAIHIPKVQKPKRRGGLINKLKRERAVLTREANRDIDDLRSNKLWDRINALNYLITAEQIKRKKNL